MAAGGFKTFTAGDVLTAADTNNYLMQGVLVFGGTASRASAIPSPVEGQITFRTDDDALEYYDGTAWQPVSTGVGDADFSNTATGTYTDSGVSYKYVTFTASGTLTVTQEGYADILVCAGGGGSGQTAGGAGGGGGLITETVYLQSGDHTVVVGAGGAGGASTIAGSPGGSSSLGPFFGYRGGAGGGNSLAVDLSGGSSGGRTIAGTYTGNRTAVNRQGNIGEPGTGGGGGGAGAAGSGATGGVGRDSAITGTTITYARGGSWNNTRTSTANRGEGADASNRAGGSGVVIVRVKV